jgi:parallel beta-helix repeat protein
MHKYKVVSGVIICLLLLSFFIVFYNVELYSVGVDGASGKDIYVDDDQRYPDEADGSLYNPFYSVQDAIDAAQDGDTIKILPGSYSGDLIIDKSITITTEDRDNTFILSNEKNAYLVDITASSVSLEGLAIQDNTVTSHRKAVIHISPGADGVKITDSMITHSKNGYGLDIDGPTIDTIIRNNTFSDTKGIDLENSATISIYENIISNCIDFPALKLVSSNRNHIVDNNFENNLYGIYTHDSSDNNIINNTVTQCSNGGIVLNGGINNNLINNTVYDNDIFGIDLGSSYGILQGNTLYNNLIGISMEGIGYNISNNTIYSSTQYGIYATSGSRNNIIFNNTFTDKIGSHALDEGDNQWNKGNVGNYWDDFYGPDPNDINNTVPYDDVVVPEVYKYIRGGVTDNYPKGIYQKQPSVSNPSPANLEEGVDRSPRLSVIVEDPDPTPHKERLDVYFYYLLNSSSYLIGIKNNVESGSTASISFSSTIQGKNAVYSYKGLGYGYIGVWYVEVEDSYSKVTSPIWIFSTAEPPANNTKPTIDIDVQEEYMVDDEIHAQIDDLIQFDASGCNDSDGEIVFYRWSFGDGTATINEVSSIHSYKSEGTYNINLAVIDDDGSSNSANMTVVIGGSANRAPSANINAPATGYVGDSIEFSSSGSSDPDADDSIASYLWDFDDGVTSAEQNSTHQYSKAGKYTVTLTLTDQNGAEGTADVEVLIKTKSTDESPGYEIILAVIAMLFVSIILRKKKK